MAGKKDTKKKKVLFVGDTHAEFAFMNYALKELKPDVAIVVGDFGYWRKSDFEESGTEPGYFFDSLVNDQTKVYFCDGNHENISCCGNSSRSTEAISRSGSGSGFTTCRAGAL